MIESGLDATARKRLATLKPGERIEPEFALEIARKASVHELGEAALRQRRARHGDRAYYVYNQHLNYTNVCRNQCRFCAFFKKAGEEGGYTYTLEEARKRLLDRIEQPIREIHITGGLNPDLPYQYYLDLLALCKELRPQAVVKAFTAVEVAHFADALGTDDATVLREMMAVGLDARSRSLPISRRERSSVRSLPEYDSASSFRARAARRAISAAPLISMERMRSATSSADIQ